MINEMAYICEHEYDRFFALPNVNGIAVGYKEVGSINTYQLCLRVMVKEKVNRDLLAEDEVVPKFYKGFITDVVEVGEIVAQADFAKYRPAPGGCQLNPEGFAVVGTFGCLVTNGIGSQLKTYVLSNNHVMADFGNYPIGKRIFQNGPPATNTIATLTDYVQVSFAPGTQNLVDCAIAEVVDRSLVTHTILQIGAITGIASAELGKFVQKYGRTTTYTTGTITGIFATVGVVYTGQPGTATFIRQITATPMSAGGDSGSIVLDSSNRVVGLLFAGSAGATTIMCDIRYVLRSFNARLV